MILCMYNLSINRKVYVSFRWITVNRISVFTPMICISVTHSDHHHGVYYTAVQLTY